MYQRVDPTQDRDRNGRTGSRPAGNNRVAVSAVGDRIADVLVTLAHGANPANVLNVLFQQKTTVRNHSGDLPGYLDWALNTAQLLRNQIRQSDIDRLVFMPRLWQLQDLTGRNDRFTNNLLSIELQEKSELFERVHAALKAEIARWSPADAELVVVDTSVFIHHPGK